eukprot:TRINITY_DN32684_c0_g1_i1.p1 TRINITY_DN32684_c0_g1~~TRINITY_DN32684_c0_g1_i1.p1  ORF type:complete len:481 (+),score=115.03 TRINITY_DN32684_c0_g1_i1:72-1514(+)
MAGLSKLLELVGAGSEWEGMPWRTWTPPSELWERLPTFVLCEWNYRIACYMALVHGWYTGRAHRWFAAWLCGTANDIFFMFMPFCDNFWQGQASVMITPRLPLYIVEMYACVMYFPSVAAEMLSRRLGAGPIAEACLTGLLAHLYYEVYDINGARFLWWTWHDADPAIQVRHAGAPVGSSLWILTYCGLQSLLGRWIAKGAAAGGNQSYPAELSAVRAAGQLMAKLPEGWSKGLAASAFRAAASRLDALQGALGRAPQGVLGRALQILFCGVVCTPMFMTAMGQLQVLSLDRLGIPGGRTYRLAILLYGVVVMRAVRAAAGMTASSGPGALGGVASQYARHGAANHRTLDRLFLMFVLGHFALHTAINAFGDADQHISTGIHQDVRPSPEKVKDIMGWEREEQLPPGGPHLFSVEQYGFEPAAGVAKPPDAIDAAATGPASHWYTVYGRRPKDRVTELGTTVLASIVGSAAFYAALRPHI